MKKRANLKMLLVMAVLFVGMAPAVAAGGTIYVDANAAGANNGTSWADAYNYLQDALVVASSGDEIWVAGGTYTPDSNSANPNGSGDRTATFQLINEVIIKGGFAGFGKPDPNARDINLYKTILSGDLAGNDVQVVDPYDLLTEPTRAENSYHVVTGSGTDANAILDGFTITAGNADGSYPDTRGGGMYNDIGSPRVVNCTFSGNLAREAGGMFNWENSSPTLTNCTFSGNWAKYGGGMFNDHNSNPMLTNCTFSGNSAKKGGGMGNVDSSPTVTNCTFSGNSADDHGGGVYNSGEISPTLTNCTFSGNSATSGFGGGMHNDMHGLTSNLTLINCIFSDNSAKLGGGMFNRHWINLILTNCTFSGNSADVGGGMYNWDSSLNLTNCILWGDTPEEIYVDGGMTVITYSNVQGGWEGNGNIDADPCFVQPGYWDTNGTPTDANDDSWIDGDYYLLPTSPCIDTGDPNYVAEPNETDIDGNPRVIGGQIDMGAYESNYIQAAMKLTPQMLNCNSKGKYVKAHLTLPEGFLPQDVDVNEPAVAEPVGIESEYIKVLGTGPVKLEICFDREAFCETITETGEIEITVIGSLTTSRYFYATDTIRIKPRR